MSTTFPSAVESYLKSKKLSHGTRDEYGSTVRKWTPWGRDVTIEQLSRKDVREFLEWVYDRAVINDGTNPGRTSNKARENLRAVMSWAWEQDLIDTLPRFPKPMWFMRTSRVSRWITASPATPSSSVEGVAVQAGTNAKYTDT